MSKTASPEEAEKEFDSPYETFKVGQVKFSDDGTSKSTITNIDKETGAISWKIEQLPGFDKLFSEVDEFVEVAKRVYQKSKNDKKFLEIYDDARKVKNKIRTHLRNEYPDVYKRIQMRLSEADIDVDLQSPTVTKANNQITNAAGFADFVLDVWNKISEKEQEAIQNNINIKQAKDFLEKARGEKAPVKEDEVDEISTSGAAGAYLTPYAFRKKGSKPPVNAYRKLGYRLVKKNKNDIEEGINDREVEGKLKDIQYDFLTSYFNGETFHAPNPDDSSRQINSKRDWDDWKAKTMDRYGNVKIKLDNTAVWYDKIQILDPEFKGDKDSYIQGKAAALDKIRQRTNFGLDEGTCGYDRDKNGKKLKGPGGLGEALSYAFSEFDFNITDDAYQAEVEEKIKKELKKVQSKPLEIPEKDLQAIIKNAENYFAKEARKEEKANRNPRKIKSTEFAQFAADYYTEEYYPENYGKDYPDKRGDMKPIQKGYSPEFKERRRRSDIIPFLIDYDVKGKDSTKSIGLYNMPDDYYTMDVEEFDKKYGVYKRREIKRRADRLKDPDFPTEKLQDKPGGPLKLQKDFYTMRVWEFDKIYGKGGEIEDEDFDIENYSRLGFLNEGDTYEKMAAKGKKAGSLKQGTVRKRLGIKKGEKIPLSLIKKELARLKKMDKDDKKKGVQLGDKNQKYYKALQLSKTLKTTTNVNENKQNPGASLGPGPKAGPDGVTDNYYVKAFKYKLVPKKNNTYVQKGSGLEVKKLF